MEIYYCHLQAKKHRAKAHGSREKWSTKYNCVAEVRFFRYGTIISLFIALDVKLLSYQNKKVIN
jgi:hypothetical protein